MIVFNDLLFDIRPGNEKAECINGCQPGDPCQRFCDCIYEHGKPLQACLYEYRTLKAGARR